MLVKFKMELQLTESFLYELRVGVEAIPVLKSCMVDLSYAQASRHRF